MEKYSIYSDVLAMVLNSSIEKFKLARAYNGDFMPARCLFNEFCYFARKLYGENAAAEINNYIEYFAGVNCVTVIDYLVTIANCNEV